LRRPIGQLVPRTRDLGLFGREREVIEGLTIAARDIGPDAIEEFGPYANAAWNADNGEMSMYTEFLLGAQGCLREDLHSDALVYRAIECRSEMLASGPVTHDNAMSALAVEVAYDCALLNLCAAEDIGAFPADFSLPAQGRRRFELELKGVGIDLVSLARHCIRPEGSPSWARRT